MRERFYAGIGSREAPESALRVMRLAGTLMWQACGMTLRSGGARGSDQAFEFGCDHVGGKKQIFKADDVDQKALKLAASIHPAWERCGPYVRKLHARNCYQVLGRDLRTPSEFVLCWTPGGSGSGGTGQAIRLARLKGIDVVDIGDPDTMAKMRDWLSELCAAVA